MRTEALLSVLVLALAAVSFLDDRGHVPIGLRFLAHGIAAVAFVALELAGIAFWWQLGAVIAVLWFTNLYNFMDGSDGLAGGMALFGFAAYALGAWSAGDLILAATAASIAAAAAAFLAFNFPPARVFMGDAGSIPLGFLAAALGLFGWREQHWPLWFPLLVFSPFVVDASVTLLKRVLRGEPFWRAHRTHYYQRLVQLGWGHRDTALAEYALMAGCGAAALWSLGRPDTVQLAILGSAALIYVVLGASIDIAWMRRRNVTRNDASAG
jgi:phospho-N-acetylmuramoyl-pentapeptide-transferase